MPASHDTLASTMPMCERACSPLQDDSGGAPKDVAPADPAGVAIGAQPGLWHAGEDKPPETSFESPQLVRRRKFVGCLAGFVCHGKLQDSCTQDQFIRQPYTLPQPHKPN